MSEDFTCDKCGRRLRSRSVTAGAHVRCPSCGGKARFPGTAVTAEKPAVSACPNCRTHLAAGAVLCVQCGYHIGLGKRLKTKHERVRRVWDTRDTLLERIAAFVAIAVVIPLLVLVWPARYHGQSVPQEYVPFVFLGWLLVVVPAAGVLLLTPLGHTGRIVLARDRKSRFWLSKRQWICLMPFGGWSLLLEQDDKAWIDYQPHYDRWGEEYNGTYTLSVARERHHAPYIVYHGTNERLMQDIADGLRDLAGVRLERR